MNIRVLVQVYTDRTKPMLGFTTLQEFVFDDKELEKHKPDEAMYHILTQKIKEFGFVLPLQFWSSEKHGVITACLDDRNHYDY